MRNYLLLVIALNIHQSSASCFGKDAHFKTTDQPVVSQTSKTDPSQVLVSWDKIIKRPECVDRYNVWVWPEGTERSGGTKVVVQEKGKDGKSVATSKTVSVEPCLNYKFLVELEEVDSMTGLNQERTGEQVFKTAATSSSSSGLTDSSQYKLSYHWDGTKVDLQRVDIVLSKSLLTNPNCLDYIQVTGSEARVTTGPRLPGSGGRSVPSSRGQALQYLSQSRGQSQPQISVGKASTLPAQISYSDVTRGSRPASPSSSSSSMSSYPAPQFAYTMARPSGGQKRRESPVKFSPPFLNSSITLTVPAKDCAQYNFELKFVGGGRDVATVNSLTLPPLADQPGYVPPPVTSVLTVSYNTAGKPLYGVKTSSGVSAACLPAYFEAYDAYSQGARSQQISQLVTSSENELSRSQEELLKSLGCQCTSTSVNLTTTDTNILKRSEANQLGQYQFQGMYKDKPYYMRKVAGTKPISVYLYQDSGSKQWRFATDLGGKKNLFFASVDKSIAVCPGDTSADGNWQAATGTFGRFKKNPNVKVVCNRI